MKAPNCLLRHVNNFDVAIEILITLANQQRDLPQDPPKWQSVYSYLRAWSLYRTWQRNALLGIRMGEQVGRHQTSAGSIDSQSVKTAGAAKESFDGGKTTPKRRTPGL